MTIAGTKVVSDNNFYSAPAGWYPDPLGLPQLRWWDSTQWTHQVAEARQPMVMQETTFAWADDEPEQEQEHTSRRERRERDRRDPVDTPAPTAQTLLQLEPPSRDDVIRDSVANPQYRTESPVSDAQAAANAGASTPTQEQQHHTSPLQSAAPQQTEQQQQRDESPLFDSMRQAEGHSTAQQQYADPSAAQAQQQAQQQAEQRAQQQAHERAQQLAQQQAQQQAQQFAQQTQNQQAQGQQAQGQPQQFGQPQQGHPQQYAQPQAQPQQFAQPGQPQQGGYYDAPVYGQQINEPQAAQYGYMQQFQAQPQAAGWVLHQGQALPDRPDFRVIHTAAVWVIALLPMLQLVVSLLLLTAFGVGANQPLMLAVWLIPYPLGVLLAFVDQRALKADGRQHTAHWALALAGAPVYLVMRAISSLREAGKGFGPELAWIGLGILLIGSIIAVPGLAIATAPGVFAAEAESSIQADAAANGTTIDVTCPTSPPVLFDQRFICEGVRADGSILNIEVSLQRVNGWIAWRVDDWGIYIVG